MKNILISIMILISVVIIALIRFMNVLQSKGKQLGFWGQFLCNLIGNRPQTATFHTAKSYVPLKKLKNMKSIKLALVVTLFLITNTLSAQKQNWIPFKWVGDSVAGKYFDKLAMTVPVGIENLPYKFEMQLDLGAVTTNVYGNTIRPYLDKHQFLQAKLDTNLVFWIQGQKNYMLKNVDLKLGNVVFQKIQVGLFKNYGDSLTSDSIKTPTVKHIGTIAPDLFKNKILIIDYPHKKLCIVDKLPSKYLKSSFIGYKERYGRIFVPFLINGQLQDLLFDTGSSIFELLTTEQNANAIGEPIISDSLKISSWGEYYMVYGKNVKCDIKLGNKNLNRATVYYDKVKKLDKFYTDEKIWGITGNAYFLNNTIIIDYKNKKFGI